MSPPKKQRASRRAKPAAASAPAAEDAAAHAGEPHAEAPGAQTDLPLAAADASAQAVPADASEQPAPADRQAPAEPWSAPTAPPEPAVAPEPSEPRAAADAIAAPLSQHVRRWRRSAGEALSRIDAAVPIPARWKPLAIAGVAALVVVAIALAIWRAGGGAKPVGEAKFAGSDACASCHGVEHDAWKSSRHAHSMQAATESTVLGRFDGAKFRYAGVETTFSRRQDRFFVRTDGPDGGISDFQIKYAFGVEPLQQYLVELPGGRLQALSIAWDSRPKAQGGERWFHLFPLDKINHRDELHWTRRAQSWNGVCADCHSLGVRKGYDASADTYRSSWAELAVGCEACHGPGSLHIDWAKAKGGDPAKGLTAALDERRGVRWTIDAASGGATRSRERRSDTEIETCAPCHARRTQIAEGWRAGMRFLDFYRPDLLEPGARRGDGHPRDDVFAWGSFVQSRMYRHGVTCGDCHEPHSGAVRANGNALCANCHAASKYDSPSHHHHASELGSQCVQCHMPATTQMIVDARHDHSLRVPRPDLTMAHGAPNACNGCHRQRSAQWADETVRIWYGHRPEGMQRYTAAFAYAERGAAEAGRNLVAVARDLSQPAFARASAVQALARFPSTQATETAKRAAGDADPLVRRASVAAMAALPPSERWASLSPLLADPVRTNRIDAAAALADVPGAGSDPVFQRAAAEYETALAYAADQPQARVALGMFHAKQKRTGEADAAFRGALALDPGYVPAYVEFADAFRLQERDADAARVLREGLARAPDDASLHHALGLALIRMKRTNDGLRELARAVQLAPGDAHVAYVYAVALNAHGRAKEALREIDRALARRPDDRDLLAAAVTFRRDGGDRAGAARLARRFAERYPDDPQATRLVQETAAAR